MSQSTSVCVVYFALLAALYGHRSGRHAYFLSKEFWGLPTISNTQETGYKNTFYPRGKWSYVRFILICNPYSGQIAWFGPWEEPSYNRIILISGLLSPYRFSVYYHYILPNIPILRAK